MRTWGVLSFATLVALALASAPSCASEDPLAGTGELGQCFGPGDGYATCDDYCEAQEKSCAPACDAGVGLDAAEQSTDVAVYVGWSEPGTSGDVSGTKGTSRCSDDGVRLGKGDGACDDPVFEAAPAEPWKFVDVRCCCVD